MTPTPTLSQAITNVESTQTALTNADTSLDQANQKLAAAQAASTSAADSDASAIASADAALEQLIQVATAAKRGGITAGGPVKPTV